MKRDNIIGVVLGSIVAAIVIAGNVRRADPHLVNTYPDVVSVAIAPLVVYVVGHRRRLNDDSSEAVWEFGVRVGATAGAVFAAGLGGFTFYWLAAWPLWALNAGVAFISTFVLSCFAAYAAGRKRILAV